MEGLANFLDSLIGGVFLTSYSLAIGGLLWGLFVLRPWHYTKEYNALLLDKTIGLIFFGVLALILIQLSKLLLKIWLIYMTLGSWPFPAFADTIQFQAGLYRLVFAEILAVYIYVYLRHHPDSKRHWYLAGVVALPVIFSGAWLVHGAGRFEDRLLLMFLTTGHQVAAAAWVGSVIQMVYLWALCQRQQIPQQLWPTLLKRFSPLGITAVVCLLMSGIPMAWKYIDSWNGLIGTGYGNLLSVKFILLMFALGFAWLNRVTIKLYFQSANSYSMMHRMPFYIEAETFILVTILFTAASLASQPPAIDIPDLTASWTEVLKAFEPRIPRTESPSHAALLAGEARRTAIIGQTPSEAATAWSDYNHNISGIFITIMSFFAMLSYTKVCSWARFWPIGFILLGIFLFFRSDAETWPLGPIGFWESTLNNSEVLQHKIATLLVFMLGVIEIKARTTAKQNSYLPYVFPFLAAFGGLMLLTHSHIGFQPKTAFLIQVGHTLMGVFSLILACGRWLELKLDKPGKNIAGFTSVFGLFQIGLILMFYREPLVSP